MLAFPRRPRELEPQQLGRIDLDDDLALEITVGVKVQVFVRRPGEAEICTRAYTPGTR